MNIKVVEFLENIEPSFNGIIVVIDVFRAFTTAIYAFSKGASSILSVSDLDKAYSLKKENATRILMGERGGLKQKFFEYGNSPAEIVKAELFNKVLIHTSSAGTQGLVKASSGNAEVITGSLVNAFSVARYIKQKGYQDVLIVAMGHAGIKRAPEDFVCAQYIEDLLLNRATCASHYNFKVRYYTQKDETENVKKGLWMPGDMDKCLSINHFSFILRVKQRFSNYVILEKIPVF